MSGGAVVARCPAKVNLSLYVLGRRPDGYHELDTLFQAVDVWDRVEAAPAATLTLECDDPRTGSAEDNLVMRAARRLRERTGVRAGARLRLAKAIPVQAGLAGGSSDAAGTLLACSRLWGLDPEPGLLGEIGAELGADVPFFLTGGTARGRGRGDRIEPLPFLGTRPLLLGIPPFGIATGEVFAALSARLTPVSNDVSVRRTTVLKWPEDKDFGFMVNDLEPVVFERWPVLGGFRDALEGAGADRALLSGSGSTVYGVFAGKASVQEAARRLRRAYPDWVLLPTRTIREAAFIAGGLDSQEGARAWKSPR